MLDSRPEVAVGDRFAFGANWHSFVELVDEARISSAADSLLRATHLTGLAGTDFLDVGCGSGLFSLAAHRLGARVHSFDFDLESVATTRELRNRFADGGDWTVDQGSILDPEFVERLDKYDMVYAWGVLHHTGDLWRAVETTARLVRPGGLLYLSIYNDQGLSSRVWRRVKHRYNRSGPVGRRLLVAASAAYLRRRWPLTAAKRLVRRIAPSVVSPSAVSSAPLVRPRGMSGRHDLVDWVGGYPFEVARPEDVFSFLHQRGFELRHLKTCGGGIGCNEFVLQRVGSRT